MDGIMGNTDGIDVFIETEKEILDIIAVSTALGKNIRLCLTSGDNERETTLYVRLSEGSVDKMVE